MTRLDALKLLLGPKRDKRDALEAELLEEYRGDKELCEIIKGAALGHLKVFRDEFSERECAHCQQSLPERKWQSETHKEFHAICCEIARIEREQCEILTNQQKEI